MNSQTKDHAFISGIEEIQRMRHEIRTLKAELELATILIKIVINDKLESRQSQDK
jgi:hypothetical protein